MRMNTLKNNCFSKDYGNVSRGINPIYNLEENEVKKESPIYNLNDVGPRNGVIPIQILEENQTKKDCPIYILDQKEKNENEVGKSGIKAVPQQLLSARNQKDLSRLVLKPIGKNVAQVGGMNEIEKESNLANYCVLPLKKLCYINRFGLEIKEKERIACQIQIEEEKTEYFEILTRDIKKLTLIIGDKFSGALLNHNIPHAAKLIENYFRDATKTIPITRIFVDYGWQQIDGKRIYLHDNLQLSSNSKIQTGMELPFYQIEKKQAAQIFFDAYKIYEEAGPISIMLSFSMMGVLYRVFKEAGYIPHFLLFINGKTGSMKTTISKILFIQLTDEQHRAIPRRIDSDTITSFERGIILNGRDTITLIDDFAPAKSSKQKADIEAKLESIIRMVGDGSTKSRSNTNLEDCRGEGVQGAVVMTGELIGKGLSSNLRCFYCGIRREKINEEMVTFFQDNPYHFTTLINYFASFVALDWEKIVECIKTSFQSERKEVKKFIKERRLVDSTVILRLTCKIIYKFLIQCGRNKTEVNNFIEEMQQQILIMAQISESISMEETLAVRFVKIINYLLLTKNLTILDGRPNEESITFIDGFCDKEFYYFLQENLYNKVNQIFYTTKVYFPLSLNEIVKELFEENIIIPSSNGSGKKTYYARILIGPNKKCNFLKIKKDTLELIAEK